MKNREPALEAIVEKIYNEEVVTGDYKTAYTSLNVDNVIKMCERFHIEDKKRVVDAVNAMIQQESQPKMPTTKVGLGSNTSNALRYDSKTNSIRPDREF